MPAIGTASSALNPVADAAYAALKVPAFTALSAIRQEIPQGTTPFPYTRIGDFGEVPNNTAGKHGRDVTFALHIFTQKTPTMGAEKAANGILHQAERCLDCVTLPIAAGWTFQDAQFEQAITQQEDVNGVWTVHLIALFRIRVRES